MGSLHNDVLDIIPSNTLRVYVVEGAQRRLCVSEGEGINGTVPNPVI